VTVISTPKAAVLLADLERGIQPKLWSASGVFPMEDPRQYERGL
jgi:hypothetical protein